MFLVYIGLALCIVVLVFLVREDWALLTRARQARGIVFDHKQMNDDGSNSFAPMVRFTGDLGEIIEVTDGVYSPAPSPPVGVEVRLVYPEGAPGKARVRRPMSRVLIYLSVVSMLVILIGHILGWLPEGTDQGPAGL